MEITSKNSTTLDPTSIELNDVSTRIPVQTLNQEDFFKILAAQLTAQDPLKPIADTDFMGQMAQFSALEQTKSMQVDIAALRTDQEMLQAAVLLGQNVRLQDDEGQLINGTVSAIRLESGVPKLVVNGTEYSYSNVKYFEPAPTTQQSGV